MGDLALYVLGSAVRAEGSDLKWGVVCRDRFCIRGSLAMQGALDTGNVCAQRNLECVCAQGICERRCTEEGREARNQQGRQRITESQNNLSWKDET